MCLCERDMYTYIKWQNYKCYTMCYDNSGICINYIRLINLNVLYIYTLIGFGYNFISNLTKFTFYSL